MENHKAKYKKQHLIMTVLAVWLIFVLIFGLFRIFSFKDAPKVQAANEFSIKTGYYYGNGTTLSINGVGFKPEVLLIKSDTAAGQLVWKSSVMPANESSYLGVATANNTETEIILDNDGFTVSPALEVNTKNVRYTYIAFAGSDCNSANTSMCVGKYTGDGTASQAISNGFQPDLVWVKRTGPVVGNFTTSALAATNPTYAAFFSAAINDTLGTGLFYKSLDANGFTVGLSNNVNGAVHYYVAFKNVAGKLIVGSFTGNGEDNRNIGSLGFEPDFVFVKQNSAVGPAFNTTECWGDYSLAALAGAGALNHIQSLDEGSFQVGNSTAVNAGGILSYWFAFGGAPDPAPTESFFMERGHYQGDGSGTRIIPTSFAPDLVFIKADDAAQFAVWSTRRDTDITHYFATPAASIASAIKSMEDASFTLGNHATVNTSGVNYEYVAFGNATSPQTGAHAADLVIGSYSGNGSIPTTASRVIDHLGITPDMVVVKPTVVAAASNINYWKSSSMTAANETAYFTATANDTGGTLIKSLDSANGGGFTMGSNAYVNTAGVVYVFFAFKEGNGIFDVGTYEGTGAADREVTGLGFQPDFVWTKRNSTTAAAHRSSSDGISDDYSQHFLATANTTGMITGFVQDGFKTGTSVYANTSTLPKVYHYAAWKSTNISNPPDTPTNSTPLSAAPTQDLNTTLAGSAYHDIDSDTQTNTQWQVDDDSDFSSPVWTRTAGSAEETTSITSANGTFANELSGKTELDHNSTYYWRVAYSDGVWSVWSTATNFITNIIAAPGNLSPADRGIVTSLTPVLTASAFSDEQPSHTASFAQWQISTSDSFSSPLYDSGTVAYGTSLAVPAATLSDRSSYYWKVRHQDSGGQWSSYSAATKFAVSESLISVTPIFGHVVVDQGDVVKIDTQVKLTSGSVINDASVNIKIYDPAGIKIEDESMTYIESSSGIYRYSYTVPSANGSYLYVVTAASSGVSGYGAANFEVRTTNADIGDIQTRITNLQANMDILIGAFISANSSVNDEGATTTSFITNLTNSTDNFYKNSVLTFTSGLLNGQVRRISAYAGDTKTITVSPALASAPANASNFSIVKQNVHVEEQAEDIQSDVTIIKSDVTYIKSKVDQIYGLLQTVDTNLNSAQATVNQLRSSQQKFYQADITDVSELATGNTYKTKLTLLNYESSPVDVPAEADPVITIYDSTGATIIDGASMAKTSTGVYEYSYEVPSNAETGLWEAAITTAVGELPNQILTDYFQITGSPAQVRINSVSDRSIPSIAADITITNEGTADDFDYRYEWCVVSNQDNACGGGDDIFYGSNSKRILKGQDFNTSLNATVPDAGDYLFKLAVYWGTEASGASQTFTATTADTEEGATSPSGGGGGVSQVISLDSLHAELLDIKGDLKTSSKNLVSALDILGIKSPGSRSLLEISDQQLTTFKEVQNKLNELGAVSSSIRQVVEQGSANPVVETYMKFNSVEINFLITNPASTNQVVKFKSFLPEEVKPENIMDSGGLKMDFDANANAYYVSADIELGPKESINKKVEIKDIWMFLDEEINGIKKQAEDLTNVLKGTQYDAQGAVLKNDIQASLDIAMIKQKESYSSPQDHIVAYRGNKIIIEKANESLNKIKNLVVESGATKGLFGKISGIQIFSVWGIVLAIIFGFGLLGIMVLSMWKSQMKLAAVGSGNKNLKEPEKESNILQSRIEGQEGSFKNHPASQEIKKKASFDLGPIFRIIKILLIIIFCTILSAVLIFSSWKIFNIATGKNVIVIERPADGGETKTDDSQNKIDQPQESGEEGKAELESDTAGSQPQEEEVKKTEGENAKTVQISQTSTGWLNIRENDSLDSEIIGKAYAGEKYTYTKERNGWYLINFSNVKSGWINGLYAKKISE